MTCFCCCFDLVVWCVVSFYPYVDCVCMFMEFSFGFEFGFYFIWFVMSLYCNSANVSCVVNVSP